MEELLRVRKNIFLGLPDNNYSKTLLSSSKMRKYNVRYIKGDVSVNVSKLHVDFPLKTKLFEPKKYFKAVKNVSLVMKIKYMQSLVNLNR